MEEVLKNFDLTVNDAWMILVGVVLFVVLWKLLEYALFLPYLKLIEAREKATEGSELQAKENLLLLEKLSGNYQEKITKERIEAVAKKLEVVNAAKKEAAKIIGAAEEKAHEYIKKVKNENADRIRALRSTTATEAKVLADMIVSKVISTTSNTQPGVVQ